jgi:hypothetical protein
MQAQFFFRTSETKTLQSKKRKRIDMKKHTLLTIAAFAMIAGGHINALAEGSGNTEAALDTIIGKFQSGEFSGAVEMLLPLHESGNTEATRLLGCLYLNGDGVEKSLGKGREYLKTAADAGNVKGMFQLGISYRHREPKKYFKYMKLAADEGHLIATQQVGLAYFYGDEGVAQNDILAYKWLFCMKLRDCIGAESWMDPLAELDERMNDEDIEKSRVMAWTTYISRNATASSRRSSTRTTPA